jgi:TolB protein
MRWSIPLVFFACGAPSHTPDGGAQDAAVLPEHDAGASFDVFFGEGLGEPIASDFEIAGPSPAPPPEILYPESGTLVPPNFVAVDVHFRAPPSRALEVVFAQGLARSVVVYAACAPLGDGCVLQPWAEVWRALAERRGAGPYEIRIRALLVDGTVTAPSEPVTLELADEPVEGAFYFVAHDLYLESTDPPIAVFRYDIGLARRSAEVFLGRASLEWIDAKIALSADGALLATRSSNATDLGSRVELFDVASRSMSAPPLEADSSMSVRFGPSRDLIVAAGERLQLVEAGAVAREWVVDGLLAADWSLDGRRIAFNTTAGELAIMDATGGEWSEPVPVPTIGTRGAEDPSIAPGGDWIGYTARAAVEHDGIGAGWPLLAASRVSDGRVVFLRRAFGTNRDRTFPYWGDASSFRWARSPSLHRGRRIFWFAFCQARDAGLLPRFSGLIHPEIRRPARNVWIAAFDPAADPDDPSRPAFRLPAQRWSRAIHTSVDWVFTNGRRPCIDASECTGADRCEEGFCYEVPE